MPLLVQREKRDSKRIVKQNRSGFMEVRVKEVSESGNEGAEIGPEWLRRLCGPVSAPDKEERSLRGNPTLSQRGTPMSFSPKCLFCPCEQGEFAKN